MFPSSTKFVFVLGLVLSSVAFIDCVPPGDTGGLASDAGIVDGRADGEGGTDAESQAALGKRVHGIFEARCAKCHSDDPAKDLGGFGSLLNESVLKKRKLLVPGSPEDSEVYKRVADDGMPEGGPPLSKDEKALIHTWISSYAVEAPTTAAQSSEEQVLQILLDDLRKQLSEDRAFVRYLRLDHLERSGQPPSKLADYREALVKLLNSLSWESEVYLPESVDGSDRYLRVDLRKLGWTARTWEGIQKTDPLKPSDLPKSAEDLRKTLRSESKSGDISVRGDWFLATASRPPLYHQILELPGDLRSLEKKLGVDASRDLKEGRVARSGFLHSGVSVNNRIIERYETPYGAYWKSLDYNDNQGVHNIFAHPLDSTPAGGEVIFNLPNGSQAYMLANGVGKRLDRAPITIVSDPRRPDRAVENGISCFSCHANGLIPKDDEIKPLVEGNTANFRKADAERIRLLHPEPSAFRKLLYADTARYQQTLARVGSRSEKQDLMTPLILEFEGSVSLDTVASDLGTGTVELSKAIRENFQTLKEWAGLTGGANEISRDAYLKNYNLVSSVLTGKLTLDLELGKYQSSAFFRECAKSIDDSVPTQIPYARLDSVVSIGITNGKASLVLNWLGSNETFVCSGRRCAGLRDYFISIIGRTTYVFRQPDSRGCFQTQVFRKVRNAE